MMAQDSRPALFVGALIGSVVGFLLLVVTDFGGWYNYNGYLGVREWGYIGMSNPISLAVILVLGLPFLGCAALSLRGVQRSPAMTRGRTTLALSLAIAQLTLVLVGGAAFAISVMESTEWWFGAGFYGSAIGAVLAVICLFAARGMYARVAQGAPPYAQVPPSGAYLAPRPPAPPAYAPPTEAQYPTQYPPQYAPPSPPPPMAPQYPPQYPMYAPAPPLATAQPPPPPPSPVSPRYCPRCGTPLALGARACPRCGAAL